MSPLNWEDAPQSDPSSKQNPSLSPFKASTGTPWFGTTLLLVGVIVGFGIGNFTGGKEVATSVTTNTLAASAPSTAIRPPTQATAPEPTSSDNLPPVDLKKDHIRGSADAKIAVVEYSDFECPFCKRVHPTLQTIVDTNKGKVMWVYRHYPLPFHANAAKEDEAAECAAELGGNDAFWKYADGIFAKTTSNGTGFALDQLVPLAKEIGLNEKKFKECLDSGKYAKHVQEDVAAGSAAGVSGTPGNFVVDLKTGKNIIVSGAQPLSSFQRVIDAILSQ